MLANSPLLVGMAQWKLNSAGGISILGEFAIINNFYGTTLYHVGVN